MFGYVLFDLDGTLTDPKEGICKSVQYALHRLGIEEPDIDKLEPFIGPPLKDSFTSFYGFDDEKALKAVSFYRERFSEVGLYENKLYPGIDNLLKSLKEKGMKTAIASSKPTVFVEKILKYFKIDKYFDVVIGSELDGSRSDKSEVVKEALLSLYYGTDHSDKGIHDFDADAQEYKSKTVMVGDRKFDIKGAKDMGVYAAGVSYGYGSRDELKKAGADNISGTVDKLTEFLTGQKIKKEIPEKFRRQTEPPKGSFLRAIYVLTPFALYYLSNVAAMSIMLGYYNRVAARGGTLSEKFWGVNGEYASGYISGISMLIGGLVILLMYIKTDRVNIAFKEKKSVYITLLSIPAGAGCALFLNLLAGNLCRIIPALSGYMKDATYNNSIPVVVGALIYVIISPVVEEILFRYLIFGRAEKTLGTKIAMFASALFFGLYHGNLLQGIYAFIMGYLMVYAYKKADNLITSVVFHMTANAVIYFLPCLPEKVTGIATGYPAMALYLIMGVAAMYGIANSKWMVDREK